MYCGARIAFPIICLVLLVIAFVCSCYSKVDVCAKSEGQEVCISVKYSIDKWKDIKAYVKNVETRYGVIVLEFFTILLTVPILIARIAGGTGKSVMKIIQIVFIILCFLMTIIAAGLESWYAAGEAIKPATGAYAKGGTWAAAAVFLWISVVLYVVDVVSTALAK